MMAAPVGCSAGQHKVQIPGESADHKRTTGHCGGTWGWAGDEPTGRGQMEALFVALLGLVAGLGVVEGHGIAKE
jgi:hypothetical protein